MWKWIKFKLFGMGRCQKCNGHGWINYGGYMGISGLKCEVCNGTGRAHEINESAKPSHNSDYPKCKSIGCQFYDEKMEFNCCANESLCEKCINSQHFA